MGIVSIVVAFPPLLPIYWITAMKAETYPYDETVERYRKVQKGTTLDEVKEIFSGYKMSDLEPEESSISFQRIYVKLRWTKGNDQMVIYYKNSGVVGKRMYGTSDPYPASDFPILEVAEFNKRL